MIRIISVLLVIIVLQVYLDETIEHSGWKHTTDLQTSHSLSTLNENLQQNHDHLWIMSSVVYVETIATLPVIPHLVYPFSFPPDMIIPVWQPPKLS